MSAREGWDDGNTFVADPVLLVRRHLKPSALLGHDAGSILICRVRVRIGLGGSLLGDRRRSLSDAKKRQWREEHWHIERGTHALSTAWSSGAMDDPRVLKGARRLEVRRGGTPSSSPANCERSFTSAPAWYPVSSGALASISHNTLGLGVSAVPRAM
jgi:hypothetical protein